MHILTLEQIQSEPFADQLLVTLFYTFFFLHFFIVIFYFVFVKSHYSRWVLEMINFTQFFSVFWDFGKHQTNLI